MRSNNLQSKGFTLLELMVTTGIVIVAGILLVGVIVNTTGISLQQSSKVEIGIDANDITTKIRQGVKEAVSIAVSYPETPNPTYTTSSTQLVLKLNSIDSSGNIIADTYDYFVYLALSNRFYFKSFPNGSSTRIAQDQILGKDLDQLTFEYFNSANPPQEVVPTAATRVKTTISFKHKIGTRVETSIATSEASLRND